MSDPLRSLAAALVADLRTPLSRLGLAAGRLDRDAGTPAQRALAAAMSEAVSDVDARIDRILRLLVAAPAPAHEDLRPVLGDLLGRVGGVLEARGVAYEVDPNAPAVRGDPDLARRCAIGLLREGARRSRAGGRLRLSLARREGRGGIELECRTHGEAPKKSDAEVASDSLDTLAAACGAALDRRELPGGFGAVLWLPGAR